MQSLLSPPSLTVGLLSAVALITVAFLLILRTLQRGLRQKLTEQLNPGETLLAEDSRANFFGLESLGGWQLRGNGLLALTDQALVFRMLLPGRTFRIPLSDITSTELVHSHCGKSVSRHLLKVNFRIRGLTDAMAWFIPEPAHWKGILDTELTRRR